MQEEQPQSEPGLVVKPGGQTTEAQPPIPVTAQPEEPAPVAEVVQDAVPQDIAPEGEHVEWTASEYLANPKSVGWFGLLAFGSILLAIVAFIVTDDWVSAIVIAVLGILVGVFAARQPQTLTYRIDSKGLTIGTKFYPYEMFKSFSIAQEHAMGFISLLPLKRFMPPLAVHYDPADEDRIAQTLAEYLPYEDHKQDVVDSISRRMRF